MTFLNYYNKNVWTQNPKHMLFDHAITLSQQIDQHLFDHFVNTNALSITRATNTRKIGDHRQISKAYLFLANYLLLGESSVLVCRDDWQHNTPTYYSQSLCLTG